MIRTIDIKEPIWSSRSIGLKISELTPEDMVDVTISYRNKEGNLIYPGTFRIPVQAIMQFPSMRVGNINTHMHEVPIEKLKDYRLKDDLNKYPQPDLFQGQIKPINELSSQMTVSPISEQISSEDLEKGYRAIRIILRGEPVAKQSTRFYVRRDKKTGNVMTFINDRGNLDVFTDTYTDPKYKKVLELFRNQIILLLKTQYQNWKMFTEIVHVTKFECIFKHPSNFPKYKIQAMINKTTIFYKTTKPDLQDNLKKIPYDAMEGLIFEKDSLVVTENNCSKRYGIRPGMIIEMKGK